MKISKWIISLIFLMLDIVAYLKPGGSATLLKRWLKGRSAKHVDLSPLLNTGVYGYVLTYPLDGKKHELKDSINLKLRRHQKYYYCV